MASPQNIAMSPDIFSDFEYDSDDHVEETQILQPRSQIDELRQKVADLEATLELERVTSRHARDHLNQLLEAANTANQALANHVYTLEAALDRQDATLTSEIESVRNDNDALSARIYDLEQRQRNSSISSTTTKPGARTKSTAANHASAFGAWRKARQTALTMVNLSTQPYNRVSPASSSSTN